MARPSPRSWPLSSRLCATTHRHPEELVKTDVEAAVGTIFKALHRLRVLHRDAEPRNLVYDADSGRFMVIGFERSEYLGRRPLGSVVASAVRSTSTYVAQLSSWPASTSGVAGMSRETSLRKQPDFTFARIFRSVFSLYFINP
ncbi:hypothetical protein G6O67_004865 [Ophiocordyceps sinensis]|uniref:Protein kinase domain-containing protein n=1 Tax=Ophiocordyceps sinensis TaxID=72228 RepID=A0A8H4PQE6_9HYPO|nr:hypothetical protein G6O67_004865 [Ophiocordyceps sinensis]